MKRPNIWTDPESLAALRSLLEEKLSAGQIARELSARFDRPVTRSQVMGKLKRAGLRLHDARKDPTKQRWSKPTVREIMPPAAPSPPATPPRPTEPPAPGIAFGELKAHSCKYEITMGKFPLPKDMRFCGQPTESGSPYCQKHRDRMKAPGWRSPEQRAEARLARMAVGRGRMRIR